MYKLNLEFKPLEGVCGIMNAVVPVNDHFRISVSYSTDEALWYAGKIGDYEAAIQVGLPGGKYWSLVEDPETYRNIYPHTTDIDILVLVDKARELEYGGEIEIFDTFEKSWVGKDYFATGYDYEKKLKYAELIWGYGRYRVIYKKGMI